MNESIAAIIAAAVIAAIGAGQGSPAAVRTVLGSITQSGQIRPHPAPATVVAGQSKWVHQIVSASQVHLPAGASTPPFFRGGQHSKPSTSISSPTSPTTAATAASPKVVLYNGLNKAGMAASGFETPPDSTGAIGPNNYVEFDNSNITVYDRSLNFISTTTLAALASQSSNTPLCDPQIQWDPTANRWLFSFLFCNISSSQQALFLGWSATSDPHNLVGCPALTPGCTGWCVLSIGLDPLLFDYPKLGHNSNYMIVGGNLYDETTPSSNPPFLSAGVLWTHLPSNGDTSCTPPPTVVGTPLPMINGDGTTHTFTPVPVNTDSSAANGYVVSAYDPAGNTGPAPGPKSKLAIWHLDSGGTFHQDTDVPVNTYDTPPSAVQLGTTDLIDTLDARLTQAVGDPTTGIWTQHTVLNAGVSKVTWYELALSGPSLTLAQEGDITGAAGEFIFNAAISPSYSARGAAIFYNRSSASIRPLIATRIRINSTAPGAMEPGELVLASSPAADMDFSCSNPNPTFPCRWGDYSAASPDPVQQLVVWGTNEFNTAPGPTPAWQDENFAVALPLRAAITQSGAGVPIPRSGVNQGPAGTPGSR